MKKLFTLKYGSLAFCMLFICAQMTSSFPFYSDYENTDMAENVRGLQTHTRNRSEELKDLYELLLKKEILEDQLEAAHLISRKSNRSPSLRLRFGKKRDSYMANPQLMERPSHTLETVN